MTENKRKIFNIILILLPIIDVITSYAVRNFNTTLTFGTFIKAFMLLYFVFYICFITGSKYRKISIKYIIILGIFTILYFALKKDLLDPNYFLYEVKMLCKILFFPIMYFGLLCFYNDSGFDKKKLEKIMFISILIYSVLLFIPFVLGLSYGTYDTSKSGFIGWYYAGNEISTVITLLFPFLYYLIDKDVKGSVIISLPIIIMISRIGTKVSFFGLVLVGLIMLITKIIREKKLLSKDVLKYFVVLVFIVSFMYNGYTLNNMQRNVKNEIREQEIEDPDDSGSKLEIIIKSLLSNRDKYLYNTHNIYLDNNSINTTLFGLGFSNTPRIDDIEVEKLVEMDVCDLFYHLGVVGLVLMIVPFIHAFYMVIKYILRRKLSIDISLYTVIILLAIAISVICGHVLLNPPVSIYVDLYLILLLNEVGAFRKNNIDSKRVSLYTLHLGFGGTERSTVDIANMLSKKYNVHIISLYKVNEQIPYRLNDNVKVIYLSNNRPKKEELKKYLKSFKLIKACKILIESCDLLYKKYILTKNLISYDNSKYVISTRDTFSKILSKNGRVNAYKVGIEHNYDISEEHINFINNNLVNLDKYVVVSKTAASIYKKYINNIDIEYIPNCVNYEYNVKSSLEKRLITVGRLEKEKGYLDLIDVFKLVHEKDSEIKLDIFGDGKEKAKIKKKISEYELDKYITMHGFKDQKEISRYYKKAGLFVMCSIKESFGIVLIESMKCGVPAIAFKNITGAKEIIKNGKNGFLIPNRDKEKMANQIIKYMKLKQKEKYQEEAIKTAEKYSFDEIQKKWLALIMEMSK